MNRYFLASAVVETLLAAVSAAPPVAPPVLPPVAPPVEQRPACICGDQCKCAPGKCPGGCPVVAPGPRASIHPPCAKGNNSGACSCERPNRLNPNPGPCTCDNCDLRCFPLGNGLAGAKDGLPAGYPAAPAGYEWRRDARGPDGWGLFQVGTVAAASETTGPAKATPVQRYGWQRVCTGTGCQMLYGPLP